MAKKDMETCSNSLVSKEIQIVTHSTFETLRHTRWTGLSPHQPPPHSAPPPAPPWAPPPRGLSLAGTAVGSHPCLGGGGCLAHAHLQDELPALTPVKAVAWRVEQGWPYGVTNIRFLETLDFWVGLLPKQGVRPRTWRLLRRRGAPWIRNPKSSPRSSQRQWDCSPDDVCIFLLSVC